MKQILNWLKSKFSRNPTAIGVDERHTPVPQKPAENLRQKNPSEDTMPTLPTLTSLEDWTREVNESIGFDPYNSGSYETSKTRSSK